MKPVPANRLLWHVLGVALAAAVAGPLPAVTPVVLLAAGVVATLALADLTLGLWRLPAFGVALPAVVRLTKDRASVLPVTLTNPAGGARRVRFALAWPAGFEAAEEDRWVDLPAGAEHARLELSCTPRRRGRFHGAMACLETASWLGLWRMRMRTALTAELRVYPNLFSERKQLAALFLARGQQGAIVRRTVGRGREFEKLRDYLPGDGFDEIHWKATAKRGRPITKVFQVERTQEIYLILDASRLSARPVVHDGIAQTALERGLTAGLVLLLAAQRQGDRFGLAAHDDRVRLFLRAGRGAAHYGACRDALLQLRSSEATPDLAEIVRHLQSRLPRRALLFFITDLTDPVLAEDFERHAGLLARRHLVMVSQLRGPGVAPLFTEPVGKASEIHGRLAGQARWHEAWALARKLKPLGVTAALLENETLAAQLVTQYLQVKRRQML